MRALDGWVCEVGLQGGVEGEVGLGQRSLPLLRDDSTLISDVLGEELVHGAPLVRVGRHLNLSVLGDKVPYVTRGGCQSPLDVPVVVAGHVEVESCEDLERMSVLERVGEEYLELVLVFLGDL